MSEPIQKPLTHCPQQEVPGGTLLARVFDAARRLVVEFDPTKDPDVATERARRFAESFNSAPAAGAVAAWVHHEDPTRVISDHKKQQALRDGGASAASVAGYTLAAVICAAASEGEPSEGVPFRQALHGLRWRFNEGDPDASGVRLCCSCGHLAVAGQNSSAYDQPTSGGTMPKRTPTAQKFDPKALRQRTKLLQGEFWKPLGVTQSGGSRYENGRPIPEAVRLLALIAYGTDEEAQDAIDRVRVNRNKS